jgi:sec-independent protein translocase protein TatC
MPLFKSDQDLFRESTMTFGEHLEDLRSCLFRAIAGLMAGCVLGLIFGFWVVHLIETPLNLALKEYYQGKAEEEKKGELKAAGTSGRDIAVQAGEYKDYLAKNNFLAEEVYVDPAAIAHAMSVPGHQPGPAIKPFSQMKRADLIKISLFRETEKDRRLEPISLGQTEGFSIYIKASLIFGAVISAPWVFYQLWSFVASGLYRHERYYVRVYLPFSVLLFLAGASLAFCFVFQPVLRFLLNFNGILGINPTPQITDWLNFVLLVPLCFGISFQLPLVMLFLERIGVFTVKAYLSKWRIAVLAIAILSAMLAPSPDPYSMTLLAAPLTLLYFGGISLCKYMPRRRSTFETPVDEPAQDA